ncbi:MAG: endo alpha-1,4 polygalactosaminidase, partial [Treponema sp.]|nr:endo alpha-1,4 polygalactosaminidase [Treponema sp.]
TVNPRDSIKILVSDYVSNNANLPDAINRSQKEGFIAFPRASDNYDYMYIPALSGANTNDINTLNDAQNYLYLISTDYYYKENLPDEGKQAMIDAIAATDYDLVIIDLFFEDGMLTRDDVNQLKTKHNGKKRLVVSYISIGSAENYRYYWQKGWKKGAPSWLKKSYDGYPDEYWVEFWNPQWQEIIYGDNGFNGEDSYIKKIIDAGFDGAYLDNVEAYYFLKNN